jgi:hypothetical protein
VKKGHKKEEISKPLNIIKHLENEEESNDFIIELIGSQVTGLKPIPKYAGVTKFLIRRNKVGILKKLYTTYKLYSYTSNKFILAGKKKQILASAY